MSPPILSVRSVIDGKIFSAVSPLKNEVLGSSKPIIFREAFKQIPHITWKDIKFQINLNRPSGGLIYLCPDSMPSKEPLTLCVKGSSEDSSGKT